MPSGVTTVEATKAGSHRSVCTCSYRGRWVMSVHAARNQARMHAEQEGCTPSLPPLSAHPGKCC